jgi:hypothetical protein
LNNGPADSHLAIQGKGLANSYAGNGQGQAGFPEEEIALRYEGLDRARIKRIRRMSSASYGLSRLLSLIHLFMWRELKDPEKTARRLL